MSEKDRRMPGILYSCYSQTSRDGEQFAPHHSFSYIFSGASELFVSGTNYRFNQGEFRFVRKNQLVRFVKHPPAGGEFRTISVRLDEVTLRSMSNEYDLSMSQEYKGENVLLLKPVPLLTNYIDSLSPYLNVDTPINDVISGLKVKEAVLLLLETNPVLKDVLFDFSEPGKIDLEAYMNENYRFNVALSRFAYLTGRSLSTFKRDFERIFRTTPNRWLQQKRLSDAYYLIKERGLKSSEVYLEVGFKDLSHFSQAFKKAYGIAPSR